MAEQQSTGLLGLPAGVWVALLVGVGGIFALSQKPFQDTRPPNVVIPIDHRHVDDGQNVDGRSWEDPLSAVALARKSAEHLKPYKPHSLQTTILDNAAHDRKTLVLTVMINGGPYTDDIEARRRARYAVLAGLYRSGFIPANRDHIGFIYADPSAQVASNGDRPDAADRTHDAHAHDIAAFEWLKRDSTVMEESTKPASAETDTCETRDPLHPALNAQPEELTRCDRVLLLWLDQEGFRDQPIEKLSQLLQGIAGDSQLLVTHAVLGPAES